MCVRVCAWTQVFRLICQFGTLFVNGRGVSPRVPVHILILVRLADLRFTPASHPPSPPAPSSSPNPPLLHSSQSCPTPSSCHCVSLPPSSQIELESLLEEKWSAEVEGAFISLSPSNRFFFSSRIISPSPFVARRRRRVNPRHQHLHYTLTNVQNRM